MGAAILAMTTAVHDDHSHLVCGDYQDSDCPISPGFGEIKSNSA